MSSSHILFHEYFLHKYHKDKLSSIAQLLLSLFRQSLLMLLSGCFASIYTCCFYTCCMSQPHKSSSLKSSDLNILGISILTVEGSICHKLVEDFQGIASSTNLGKNDTQEYKNSRTERKHSIGIRIDKASTVFVQELTRK